MLRNSEIVRGGDYEDLEEIHPGSWSPARPPRKTITQNLTLKYTVPVRMIVGIQNKQAEGAVRIGLFLSKVVGSWSFDTKDNFFLVTSPVYTILIEKFLVYCTQLHTRVLLWILRTKKT